ncbi:MAG: NAD(P)-dependent oxidoreductase [Candidatus Omnitrophota bacterium]
MKIFLTGGTGLLGNALIQTKKTRDTISTVYIGDYSMEDREDVTYHNIDICDEKKIKDIFFHSEPDIVIHTAGIANVDHCENNYKESYYSNVIGTKNIISLCEMYQTKLIYVSTNAVFDGKNAPYKETDKPSPINIYGKLKLECEDMVRNSGLKHIIVRPILMYGWNNQNERSNTVTWLLHNLLNGKRVNIVDDIYENPLFNNNCAEIIWSLLSLNKEGLYHIAGRDVVSRYEFAKLISKVFCPEKEDLISPVTSDFFKEIAPRPKNTSFNISKITKELNTKPLSLEEGLCCMKRTKY